MPHFTAAAGRDAQMEWCSQIARYWSKSHLSRAFGDHWSTYWTTIRMLDSSSSANHIATAHHDACINMVRRACEST